ncbi:MAG: VOC family protein [Anaerolineae bacterium]
MIKHLNAALMCVDSLAAAESFWCGKLGYKLVVDAPLGANARWVELGLADSATTLAFVEKNYAARHYPELFTRPPDVLFETDDARAEYRRFKQLSIPVTDLAADDYSTWFNFDDQDGNTFMVLNPRRPSRPRQPNEELAW